MGTLYIVATPIGNLKDITLRAIEVLQRVAIIACEDTRKTGFLLQKISKMDHTLIYDSQDEMGQNTKPQLLSYYEQNELERISQIIAFLKNGNDIALVSDAGTPTISDPGFKLIRECIKEDIRVESIPGASSIISALVSSGLPTDKFVFIGYLPHKPGHRKTALDNIAQVLKMIKMTVIILEAPHKLIKTLEEMKQVFGNKEIVLARELTKIHEEVSSKTIEEWLEYFAKRQPKGEFVVLFHL